MTTPDYVVVIPARLQSTRLPRKPLADIAGKPMIVHTYERALEAVPKEKLYIATDDDEIADACSNAGANVVMTSEHHLTGTDRIAEFAKYVKADIYINVQGDEPLISPNDIALIIEASIQNPQRIINGWAPIKDEAEYRSLTIPKLAIREDGRLLYMSRAPIPGSKSDVFTAARKQICVYAFPYDALQNFTNGTGKTALEALEDIEILRFLERGYDVQMVELSGGSLAVDTPEDLEKVRKIIEGQSC